MSTGPRRVNVRRAADAATRAQLAEPCGGPVNLDAHDGEVMGAPRVVPIFWGEEYWTGPINLAAEVSTFLGNILSSNYISPLNEYNVGAATLEMISASGIRVAPKLSQRVIFKMRSSVGSTRR
jgi:hypothetical protein